MKLGKVPPEILEKLLQKIPVNDPRVLLGPQVGEDVALIDMGPRVLVAKTDPITFATDLIGWYAVNVNANDVACAGARPRWFLATLLMPQNSTSQTVASIFQQLTDACASLDVTLIGGHSEVTRSVTQAVVVGCMLGEVDKDRAITTAGARVGDSIVVTKGISLEGSALLARERRPDLEAAGLSPALIDEARDLLFNPGISVVKDALTACDAVLVHSLHDPTEGGLATGLWEVANAAGVGMVVQQDKIPIFPQCRAICDALGLDPLGLLASGSLLVALPPGEVAPLLQALSAEGIQAYEIGRVTPPEEGILMEASGKLRPLPTFQRDELARYFEA